MSRACLAIDVGGTKIAAALIDADGKLLAEVRRPTEAARGGIQVVHNMVAALEALAPACAPHDLAGIGVSAAGVIDSAGARVVDATDAMPGWAGTELGAVLGARFKLPVAAANDVHCALLGELWCNPRLAGSRGGVVMLALGTGLGGALAQDGRLLAGRRGLAGHFGRMLAWNAAAGALEPVDALVSGSALVRRYREAGGALEHDGAAVMALASAKYPAACASVNAWLEQLALLLHNLYWSLDPALVLLGGGVLDSRAHWWDALVRRVQSLGAPLQLEPASLGNAAGVVGAASLILHPDRNA